MRRRLTVAVLLLVAGTVVATSLASYVLVRRATLATAQQELSGQGRAISTTLSGNASLTVAGFRRQLAFVRQAGNFAAVRVLLLSSDGTLTGQLPPGVTGQDLDPTALQAGSQVSGHTPSRLVFTAVPTPLARYSGEVPVLVITRRVVSPFNGLTTFGLVGAIGLLVAALVAAALARRFTRPLVAAVGATRRIASGDLDATVAVGRREDPEFVQLATAINAMAAALARARGQERQFLLSVSHELRTPLTSIRGYAEAVLDGTAEDPASAAGVIAAESRRLERLVQDLLDLARLDADRFSFELQPVDTVAVAHQVANGFRPRAAALGLDLHTTADTTAPPWALADYDRLGQVVANLVENAATFARSRITVGTGPARPGGPVLVWVEDDGPGIPADQLDRVFERHFTSDRAEARRKGSGLGLAIVAELVGAMGGSVRADSPVPGGGTRLVVALRAVPPPGTAPGPPPAVAGPPG